MNSRCNRCFIQDACSLYYNGEYCLENRDVNITNFDLLRSFDLDEMSKFLEKFKNKMNYFSEQGIKEWLQGEA